MLNIINIVVHTVGFLLSIFACIAILFGPECDTSKGVINYVMDLLSQYKWVFMIFFTGAVLQAVSF